RPTLPRSVTSSSRRSRPLGRRSSITSTTVRSPFSLLVCGSLTRSSRRRSRAFGTPWNSKILAFRRWPCTIGLLDAPAVLLAPDTMWIAVLVAPNGFDGWLCYTSNEALHLLDLFLVADVKATVVGGAQIHGKTEAVIEHDLQTITLPACHV